MLDFDTGHRLLAELRLPIDRSAEFAARAATLPAPLAAIAGRFIAARAAGTAADEWAGVAADLAGCDERQLVDIFSVLLPGLAAAAVRTWRSIGAGFISDFRSPLPCRARDPGVNLGKQMDWLRATQRVFLDYPAGITTAEGLAVWAPYFVEPLIRRIFETLVLIEGAEATEHVGRLLAGVIDEGDDAGHNVLDTLRLTLDDRHPASMFAGHVPRALWRSGNAEAHAALLECLASGQGRDHHRLIVRGAAEAGLDHVQSVLRCLLAHRDALSPAVRTEILGWFGLPAADSPADAIAGFVEQILEAIDARSLGLPCPTDSPGLLFHAWAALAEDVHAGGPILAQVLAGEDIDARVGAVLLAGRVSHPAALPVLDTALSDPDLRVALIAVSPLEEAKRQAAPADRPNRLRRLIDLARRVIDAEPGLEALSGAHPGTFLVRIQAAMRNAWADEPVTVLGDMIDRPEFYQYLYLPADYCPPDTAAIEPLIDRARPLPRGQSLADTRPHCFLARAVMTPAQWYRWLAPQAESQAGIGWQQRRLVRNLDTEGMTSVCERLCSDPRPRVRRAGLKIVLEALETAGGGRCLNLARSIVRDTARSPRQSVESDDESVLLAAIEADLARRDGVEIPSLPGAVGAAFPDLVATPRWTPRPRPIRRFTPRCAALFAALDTVVGDFFAEHGDVLRDLATRIPGDHRPAESRAQSLDRLPWFRPHLAPWLDRLHLRAVEWWSGNGPQAEQGDGLDLVRLGTLRRGVFVDDFKRTHLESIGIDFGPLVALQVPQGLFGRLEPTGGSEPEVVAEFAAIGAANHARTVCMLFEHVLALRGTWQDYDWMLDVAETMCAAVSAELLMYMDRSLSVVYGQVVPVEAWLRSPAALHAEREPVEIVRRLFVIRRHTGSWRWHDGTDDGFYLRSHAGGGATLADMLRAVLDKPPSTWESPRLPREFVEQSRTMSPQRAEDFIALRDRLAACLVAAETTRANDTPTDWTTLAATVGHLEGFEHWLRAVEGSAAIGLARLAGDRTSRRQTISRLVKSIHPQPTLDQDAAVAGIADLLARRRVTQAHLLQAAFLAPQWLGIVGRAIGWPELPRLYEWLTELERVATAWNDEDDAPSADDDADPPAANEPAAGPAATAASPTVERWYERVPDGLDDRQITRLLGAARVIMAPKLLEQVRTCINILHQRVDRGQLVARALAAEMPIDPMPLAFVPLTPGAGRLPDLIERRQALAHLRQVAGTVRRKRDAIETVDRALSLLARRAGLGTAERLDWLLAAAAGYERPDVVTAEECEARIVIDRWGRPACLFTKRGKGVKTAAAPLKKHPGFKSFQQRFKAVQAFFDLTCSMATEAMLRCWWHAADEWAWLGRHPLVQGVLSALLVTDGGRVGLLTADGRGLTGVDGRFAPLNASAPLRIVHPVELAISGDLPAWIARLQAEGIGQPFEQVERRVHLAADHPGIDEAGEFRPLPQAVCDDQRLAAALYAAGWRGIFEPGVRWRRFPSFSIEARVALEAGLDGATRVTTLSFTTRASRPLSMGAVPPIVFSEAVRDLERAAEAAQVGGPS
ncbi:hypothetical protein LBMAG47_29470 [Planctomycetia bacterium]|nr:hypothetical protein LBMAG47_29470 [Planctomycetia bacterium]